ncbi:flavin reductase family protein [Actinoplanes sp. NPDC049802]|uniref:flavin reductase family protein n=1 Tax=Actinoplanes sp. NPDC049802 TaxID=3154742 RepID=UPI0033D3ABB1
MTGLRADVPASRAQDSTALRRTFGAFCTGVTVVTVGGEQPRGMTANSFTAVSLDPALVLVCVARDAVMHELLLRNDMFGISVLSATQEQIARHFASRRPRGAEQFAFVDTLTGELSGAPMIARAAAHFECRLWRTYDGGDHTIVVGRVLAIGGASDEDVLFFLRGRFGSAA